MRSQIRSLLSWRRSRSDGAGSSERTAGMKVISSMHGAQDADAGEDAEGPDRRDVEHHQREEAHRGDSAGDHHDRAHADQRPHHGLDVGLLGRQARRIARSVSYSS